MELPDSVRRWRPADVAERHLPGPVARLVRWVRSDESLSTAASLAFFALISLPPMMMIALWIAGLVAGDERIRQLGEQLAALAPQDVDADEVIVDVAAVAVTLGWTSVLAALWPATAYGAGLARAFDRLTPTGRRPMDGVRGRVLVVVLIAVLPLVVLCALGIVVFIPQLVGQGLALGLLGIGLAGLATLAILSVLLAVLYNLFSPADVGPRAALRGGAWAAAMITVISTGYALYLRLGANFEERYGSSAVAVVILLGLWLYLANGALIVGYKTALIRADAPAWEDAKKATDDVDTTAEATQRTGRERKTAEGP